MTHTPFNSSPGYALDNLNDLMFGDPDGDVEMAASPPATDIFNGGGGL